MSHTNTESFTGEPIYSRIMDNKRDMVSGLHMSDSGLDYLKRAINAAKQHEKTIAVLFVDLDGYFVWNNKYGHVQGDVMLRQLAIIMETVVGNTGLVARIGGDEILIVLPDASEATVKHIAEQITSRVAQEKVPVQYFYSYSENPNSLSPGCKVVPLQIQEVPAVSVTIGIALHPANGTDVDALIHAAEQANLRGKKISPGSICMAE